MLCCTEKKTNEKNLEQSNDNNIGTYYMVTYC